MKDIDVMAKLFEKIYTNALDEAAAKVETVCGKCSTGGFFASSIRLLKTAKKKETLRSAMDEYKEYKKTSETDIEQHVSNLNIVRDRLVLLQENLLDGMAKDEPEFVAAFRAAGKEDKGID